MQLKKRSVAALAVCSLLVAGAAQAGPLIRVTVKNLGNVEAKYSVIGNNEALTNANAQPKPEDTIKPQQSSSFEVRDQRNPAIATAVIRYSVDGKTCVFSTFYSNPKIPKWTKDAQSSNGARCTAAITSVSASDHSWTTEFTIR
ncbi:hypothetical protein [Pseudomonas sp. Z2-11]